jgi:hypothetical protein
MMSLQVMLAFIQVIVSGVLAGAARWTGWSWYGLNSYTYTYAPWMGVGIVALLLGLLSECRSAQTARLQPPMRTPREAHLP